MFNVYFYVGENFIVNETMQYLPRQGEKVRVNSKLYKVTDVVYTIKREIFSATEVLILLEEINK